MFGLVSVQDRVWRSQSRNYLRPLPARLGVSSGGRSRRLDRVLTDFGSEQAFARAAESVREHYGFAIDASSVRAATLRHAQRAQDQLQAGYDQPFRGLVLIEPDEVEGQEGG